MARRILPRFPVLCWTSRSEIQGVGLRGLGLRGLRSLGLGVQEFRGLG